jgi:hypothetical protein
MWEVSLNKVTQSLYDMWGFTRKNTKIEEMRSDRGVVYGPEALLSYKTVFIRGSYIQGVQGFSASNDARRRYYAGDIGVIGPAGDLFVGWRKAAFHFPGWKSGNISDHEIDTPVWGFNVGGPRGWFLYGIGTATNFPFFQIGDKLDNVLVFEGEAHIGGRIGVVPLSVVLGYSYWWFGKAIDSYYVDYRAYHGTATVQFEDAGYGPHIDITYNF